MERKAAKMKKLRQTIMKDIGWKLLSVCIAIGLWFMVINIENPIDTRSYSQTIKFENEDILTQQGLTITNMDDFLGAKVTIKVKSERGSLDRLSQYRNYIQATVDLKKATASIGNGESIPLNVEVKLPAAAGDNFEIVSKDPLTVSVKLESIVTVEKTVTPIVTGDTQTGYVMENPTASPNTVKISGPESAVNKVDTVKAPVSISAQSKDVILKSSLAAYDTEGNIVQGIQISPSETDIRISVNKSKKIVVKVTAQGLPQDGYIVEKIEYTPKVIEVVGKDTVLAGLSEIVLPVINIGNQSETIEENYDVSSLLPTGVTVYPGSNSNVAVTVQIKKEEERTLLIPGNQISLEGSLPDNLKATFRPEDVTMIVKGPDAAIQAIEESKLAGKVNIADFTAGTHHIPISFVLPEGVSIVGQPPSIEVIITDEANPIIPETPQEPDTTSEPNTTPESSTENSEVTQE